MLTVAAYDKAETDALLHTPNRAVQCAHPKTFIGLSYPPRIPHESAAWRYADAMHEGRTEQTFKHYIAALTSEELDLCTEVARRVGNLTESLYNRRIVPRSALLRAVNVVRHIRYVAKPGARIFEIGAGSGYVGALLALLGYRYGCTDITQGFYLWQNHLLSAFGNVEEQATGIGQSGDLIHTPWWKFYRTGVKTGASVVTCNTALCEMEQSAIGFIAAFGRGASFVCDTWGLKVISAQQAMDTFTRAGYRFFLQDAHAIAFGTDADTSAAIHEGRAATLAAGKHSLLEYDAMITALGGALETEDERFIAYVSGK
jgi:hypothetical protein